MRLLTTSNLLAGTLLASVFLPVPVVWSQSRSVDGDVKLTSKVSAEQSSSANSSTPSTYRSLFSIGAAPELRSGDNAESTASLSGASGVQAADGRITYPVRPEQPLLPAQPEQGPGRVRGEERDLFEPDGVRLGTLQLYPSISFFATATDNVDNASSGDRAVIGDVEFEVRAESDWSRHQLTLDAKTGLSGYKRVTRKPDHELNLNGTLELDLMERTKLTLTGRLEQEREDANNAELVASGGSANVTTVTGTSASLNHELGLVQLELRGAFNTERYEDDGSRDFNTKTVGGRVGYQLTDQIVPFVDVEASRKSYEQGPNARDGDSLRGAVGVAVKNRQTVSGEASVGVMTWKPELDGQKDDSILFADASINWSPNTLWSFTGGLKTGLTSTSTGATSVSTHALSLGADYAVRRDLKLAAASTISLEQYRGIGREDLLFDATLSAEYSFNRYTHLIARVSHERRDSNEAGADFDTNKIAIGLKFQK